MGIIDRIRKRYTDACERAEADAAREKAAYFAAIEADAAKLDQIAEDCDKVGATEQADRARALAERTRKIGR